MRISVPQEMFGNNPEGFIDHLGLVVQQRPSGVDTEWEVSAKNTDLVYAQTLHGPALKRSRFDVSPAPTPEVPGGMPVSMFEAFEKITQTLDANPTLAARLDRIITTLIAVPDNQLPAAVQWGSTVLSAIPLERADGTTEPLFPRHSVHDVRIAPLAYRWSKLPQVLLRLRHTTAAELVEESKKDPDKATFQSSGALLEGTVFGGLYFAPLLGSQSPSMWGIGVPRVGQVIVYTFGRLISGRGFDASRDQLDCLQVLIHHSPTHDFAAKIADASTMHKAVFSETIDWWASRVDKTIRDIFSPTTYLDGNNYYVPEAHQRWMLNLEQLFTRIGAIVNHPRDRSAQLMLMFPAMDILADSFTGANGIGQLMTPARIRKRIKAIEERVPTRIQPLVMAPAYRALAAAQQVADEFFAPSPNPDATIESRLIHLWNARRNTTHGFNENAEILAEHTGRLPADIVMIPMVYLLDILTDRDRLLQRIARSCRTAHPGRTS
ncbi:hypothetical protein [Mycobacterium sp. C31M]